MSGMKTPSQLRQPCQSRHGGALAWCLLYWLRTSITRCAASDGSHNATAEKKLTSEGLSPVLHIVLVRAVPVAARAPGSAILCKRQHTLLSCRCYPATPEATTSQEGKQTGRHAQYAGRMTSNQLVQGRERSHHSRSGRGRPLGRRENSCLPPGCAPASPPWSCGTACTAPGSRCTTASQRDLGCREAYCGALRTGGPNRPAPERENCMSRHEGFPIQGAPAGSSPPGSGPRNCWRCCCKTCRRQILDGLTPPPACPPACLSNTPSASQTCCCRASAARAAPGLCSKREAHHCATPSSSTQVTYVYSTCMQ
jgi:hypothetical protein